MALDGNERGGGSGKITVGERSIGGGYLKALGAPLLAGQSCPELGAVSNIGPKALVNRRFADLYGKNQNLVGRHMRGLEDSKGPPTEIVGIASDMREDALNAAPVPYVYMCLAAGGWPDPEYVVRTHGDPRRLLQEIRPLVHSVDGARAVFGVKTLEQVLDQTLDQPRLNTRMLALFALAAMALAGIGLYSLVSLVVTARTREIGVRMTLGAAPSQIVAQVAGGVAPLLGSGIATGLLLTLLANRALRSVLFGVSPTDAMTLGGAVVTLTIVSVVATLVPARRAAKIDPLEAIRSE
ncbi:MAG TPA: FtsX-like permease family protein [Bryobacteraceae bacterium]|nr:FtsX-like permease family protein [Bryobacteraceae bacterium]